MSEEDLELLITLDDPEGAPEVDNFHDPKASKAVEPSITDRSEN